MTKEQWKENRSFSNQVSTESLKSVINDYENKLCEMHSQILVLNSDKERLKEDIKSMKEEVEKTIEGKNKFNKWWLDESKKVTEANKRAEKYKRYSKRIVDVVRAKWWVRGKMLKFLLKEF